MIDNTKGNKRIAKNTLVIYANMFVNIVIGLYSSRLVLDALGVSDYGLYSVAAGAVLFFSFIQNSLSDATIRFVNVEMGKQDGDINRIFNVLHVLHIAMALMLFVLLEVAGVFYITHYLNVDAGKESDAMFVFQVAAVMMCIGVINIPFSSMFNATEKFLFSAVVNIIGKLIEFSFVIWLLTYDGNRLRFYACIMALSTLIPFVIYHLFCYRYWPEIVRWKFVRQWRLYKEALVFSNYNLLSGVAIVFRGHGCALIINYFFGTTVNGAFAIAKAIERHVSMFSRNLQNAATPQLTQNYSSGNMERVFFLTSRVGRYSMFLMLLVFFPLWAEMDFVLDMWLVKVPDGALEFCKLILLMVFVSVTDGGVGQVVNASGNVAKFRLTFTLLTLSCVLIGIAVLSAGASAYMMLVLFIAADLIWRVVQLWMVHRILHFPALRYCREAYWPVAKVSLLMVAFLALTSLVSIDSILWHVVKLLGILLMTILTIYYIGLQQGERKKVLLQIKMRICKKD